MENSNSYDSALRKFLEATIKLSTDEQKTAFDKYLKEHEFDEDQKERFLRLVKRFIRVMSLKIEGYTSWDMNTYFAKFFYDFCFYLQILNDKDLETQIEAQISILRREYESLELDLKVKEYDEQEEKVFLPQTPNFSAKEWDKTFYIETKLYQKYLINLLAHLRSEAIKMERQEDTLKQYLTDNSFFELQSVKSLSDQGKTDLIKLLQSNNMPYKVAMLGYLGFIAMCEEAKTKKAICSELSKLFNASDRAIKGNLSVLNDYSTENRERYTAWQYIENVKKDYLSLK